MYVAAHGAQKNGQLGEVVNIIEYNRNIEIFREGKYLPAVPAKTVSTYEDGQVTEVVKFTRFIVIVNGNLFQNLCLLFVFHPNFFL